MNEMIERVARALHDAVGEGDWDYLKPVYMKEARAGIEAMKPATDQQRNNYFKFAKEAGHTDVNACFVDAVWERSIDAILNDNS